MRPPDGEISLQDGRFLPLESLGRGGMGHVYRAFDRAEQRLVALKVPTHSERPGPAHPLAAEFDTWSRLRHPHIVQAYEMGLARSGPIARGTPYLVLEHVAGGPVHEVLRPGRVDRPTIETVALQLLQALSHVHAAGFVHRDVKPGNVLVRKDPGRWPRIKLTDFGLSVRSGLAGRLGVISGSLPYVSPEALLGRPVDGRSDLYGLGILLHQLATGRIPTERRDARGILLWHLAGGPVEPGRARARLGTRLARLMRRLTARRPDERPASAEEAMALLGRGGGSTARSLDPAVRHTDRNALRLALDAARLGALRTFRLPPSTVEAGALVREVRVWSQVRGLRFHRLTGARRGELARLVLRLLHDRGRETSDSIRRFSLRRNLPLDLLGSLPIPALRLAEGACNASVGAGGIARFLLECAARRAMVIRLEPGARRERMTAAVVAELQDAAARRRAPAVGRGGLLLLL